MIEDNFLEEKWKEIYKKHGPDEDIALIEYLEGVLLEQHQGISKDGINVEYPKWIEDVLAMIDFWREL